MVATISPTGVQGKNAFGIGATWGTEVAATDLLVDVWMSMKEATPNLNFPKGAGSMYKRSANPMEAKADVNIKGPFSITQFEKILKIFHGQHYRSSAVETTAYKHSYWLQNSAQGFITGAQHAGGSPTAKVLDSAFLNTMKITGKDGDTPLEIEFAGIGRRLMRSPHATTTNTPATIDALTAPGVDAYEKKITLIHGSTTSGLNAGYFKVQRLGTFAASTAVVTSGGGGNATRGSVTFPSAASPDLNNKYIPPETITVTFTAATTFTVAGSISGALGSGSTGVAFTATTTSTFGNATQLFDVTITAGGSPMASSDTIVWQHTYNSEGTDSTFKTSSQFYPSSIDFSVDKKMKGMASASRFISLGSTEDQRDIKLKFSIPSYMGTANDVNSYDAAYCLWADMQYQQNGTIFYYKIDCYFELPQLAGAITQKYYLRLTIPRAALKVPDWQMTGPGLLPINLEFEVLQPFTVPSDFSGFANSTTDLYPYGLELCNKLSTDT